MANNYNSIAKYYDLISKIIYGKSLIRAQIFLVKFIPANSSVLIVGGGTGWILEEISKLHSESLKISYVEISAEMIALAQKRNYGKNKVSFIHLPAEDFLSEEKYDVILTPFFFDNFLKKKIEIIFNNLSEMLADKGLWLYADFLYDKKRSPLWQKFLLKTMYLFFRITANIEAQELIDMEIFFQNGFEEKAEKLFYADFIRSAVYRKR